MDKERLERVITKTRNYVENLTINSEHNKPEKIVTDVSQFFTWDNESRSYETKPYLFNWSYYSGIIMEGLYDCYETDPAKYEKYLPYIKSYFDNLIEKNEDGKGRLIFKRAGYVDFHGVDCYKTAAILERLAKDNKLYDDVVSDMYDVLTNPERKDSKGNVICKEFMPEAQGHNYYHCWVNPPKYLVWLDGIYMIDPFLAHHAARVNDEKQFELLNERLDWVADTLLAPNGMYYHAGNSKDDVCKFFWTRAIGWYGMAMADIMECLPEKYMEKRIKALKLYLDGMLKYLQPEKLWANLADRPVTDTNRLESSGSAMIAYAMLKGTRKGWLPKEYGEKGLEIFEAIVDLKLKEDGLHDIYRVATASGENNYENIPDYRTDEGKGVGPFIKAYSEVLYL